MKLASQDHTRAFRAFIRSGLPHLSREDRAALEELRAQGSSTGAGGGFTIPQTQIDRVWQTLGGFLGPVRAGAEIITTETGSRYPIPAIDDIEGELKAEGAVSAEQDSVFSAVNFEAYNFTSRLMRFSIELAQDSDPESWLYPSLLRRIGRVSNRFFTTGTGTGQPQGVVPAATVGKTGLAGQTTTLIPNDLYDLMGSLPAEHRVSEACGWMLHPDTLLFVRRLADSAGAPLFPAVRGPDGRELLLGYPVNLNAAMPTMAAGARSVLFGDFAVYRIRRVGGLTIRRFDDRFAADGQVGFIGWWRMDGRLVDGGAGALRCYVNSAT